LSEAIADLLSEYEQVEPPSSFPSESAARLLWGSREDLPPASITPGDDASASLARLETRLADLVELASRVIRECAKVVPLDEAELVKAVERAAGVLARGSSPITQVKIIRSCLNNPFLPLIPSLQMPLRSDIAWVRDQALIAVVSDEALARTVGSDTGAELAYDLAGGTVIQRIRLYAEAIKDGQAARKTWWNLGFAFLCECLNPMVFLVVTLTTLFLVGLEIPRLLAQHHQELCSGKPFWP